MKSPIGFFGAIIFSVTAPAQHITILKGQDAAEWNNMVREVQKNYTLTADFILNPPIVQFPPDMMDTLKKYDWLQVADYWYNNSEWGYKGINETYTMNQICRYQQDGTQLEIIGVCGMVPDEVYDYGRDLVEPRYVKDAENYTWLCWDTGNPGDCERIVYYQDGLLIIDLIDSTNEGLPPVNHKRRIRNVYLALPQTF